MKQHHLPQPHFLARDQRCAIGQRGNHPSGKVGIRLRQHLRGDRHIIGNLQPVKRRVFGEGLQGLWLAPAHRAAHSAAPRPQAHRHQHVFFAATKIACGHADTGKAHQQSALVHPFHQTGLLIFGQLGHIGQNDHIGVGGQHIFQPAFDQVRRRVQRLFQVMQRRQQLQPLLRVMRGDQGHLAAAQTVIGQRHSTRRMHTLNGEPRNPVAQFGRQAQRHFGCVRACLKYRLDPRQFAFNACGVQPDGRDRHRRRICLRTAHRRDL